MCVCVCLAWGWQGRGGMLQAEGVLCVEGRDGQKQVMVGARERGWHTGSEPGLCWAWHCLCRLMLPGRDPLES